MWCSLITSIDVTPVFFVSQTTHARCPGKRVIYFQISTDDCDLMHDWTEKSNHNTCIIADGGVGVVHLLVVRNDNDV